LKKTLKRIQKEGRHELMYQLQEVVIRADLLDKATIMEREEHLQMITEGFATVAMQKGSKFRACISEPLALETAIEFFRDDQEHDLYESRMMKFMFSLQDDHSAFGKAAEWYLAWVSSFQRLS
jgi:hypothetical protein